MTDLPATSTLRRPSVEELKRYRYSDAGRDTVRTFLTQGYSLAICCRACPRLSEWTPPELLRRFGSRLDVRIGDIAQRLSCTGEGGCGSKDIAVFPHLYDLPWTWPPAETSD